MRLILVLCCVLHGSLSIYEDQIGLYDWNKQFVGPVQDVITTSTTIVVTTNKDILAGLSSKTGAILWRHKFTPLDKITLPPILLGSNIITHHTSNTMRYWDVQTGGLTLQIPSNHLLFFTALSSESLLRVTRSEVLWGTHDKYDTKSFDIGDNFEFAGSIKSGNVVEVYLKGPAGGILIKFQNGKVETETLELPENLVFGEDSLAALQQDTLVFKTVGESTFQSIDISTLGVKWRLESLESAGRYVYIAHGSDKTLVFTIRDKSVKPVKVLEKEVTGVVSGSDHVTLVTTDNEVLLVQLSNGYQHDSYRVAEGRGGVTGVRVLPTSHSCTHVSTVRVPALFVRWADASIGVVGQNASCGWVREESLASIVSVTMLDLPSSTVIPENLQKHSNPFKIWVDRVGSQLRDIQQLVNVYFGTAYSKVSPEMERDAFNLNKLIFAISDTGKIHTLHSNTGRLIASRYLPDISPLSSGEYKLYVIRTSSHYPLPPQVAVVAMDTDQTQTVLLVINPYDCSVQFRRELGKIEQVQLTSVEDSEFSKVLLMLADDKTVYTFPPDSHRLVAHIPLYFTVVYPAELAIRGYQVKGTSVSETWSTHLRCDKILSVETKPTNDAAYHQGRVLGDRSVLHKYINPNVIAVAMETGAGDKGVVDILLFDMISGSQLYHARHKQYTGPVHLVLAEHWLIYHFYCTKQRRYETVVVEFYLARAPNTTEFSSLFPYSAPFFLHQAYISPAPVSAVRVTNTLKSITNRAVLFAETSGRIAVVPKALLDPRRPTIPTAEDRAEQLISYTPQLTLSPLAYITYNNTLLDVRGMTTSVTGLESTCLLFVYGTDLFFTRVTPAKTFDMLNEDFDYYLIVGVLLGLCIATIATQALAENKALNKKWK